MPTPAELQAASDRARLKKVFSLENPLVAAGADVLSLPVRGVLGAANTALRLPRALGADIPFIPEAAFGGNSSSLTPYYDRLRAPTAAALPVSAAVPDADKIRRAGLAQEIQTYLDKPNVAPAKQASENYFVNNLTGVRTDLNFDPAIATPSPVVSGLPRLAGAQESTGYQPKTLAGALVKNQETKRQAALRAQDIQNALTVYDTAGRQQAAQAELGERKLGREATTATAAAKLGEEKRQFEALQALPKFEYRTKYNDAGAPIGTEVFASGQPVKQPSPYSAEQIAVADDPNLTRAQKVEKLKALGLKP